MTGRFGQLTYTSFDGRGRGGWQIKDQLGITPVEQDLLRARIDPNLSTATALPRFPSREEVAAFPRRLVFGPAPSAGQQGAAKSSPAVAWWHHAPAGLDGSGRPGNVFTHVQLDRAPDGPGQTSELTTRTRPIDLWRSPDWLTPFGADAVRDCVLTAADPPRPGTAVGVAQVAAYLLDVSHYRLGLLGALLDACAAALAGGPQVVLATRSTDTAALWIAAVSHLMSARTAHRFAFSTLERPPTIHTRLGHGIVLCCVPRIDYDALNLPARPYVLLAEDEEVATGDLDGAPHVSTAGDHIAVTEWSILAKVTLIDELSAVWAMSQLDRMTEGVSGPVAPDWPLAMVVADPDAPESFRDAANEAARVLVRRSPQRLGEAADLLRQASAMVEENVGTSAADVWRRLEQVAVPGAALSEMGELLLTTYVARAIVDPNFLAQRDGPPVPTASWSAAWPPAELAIAVEACVRGLASSADDDLHAVALVALTNFLSRLGLLNPELRDPLLTGLERMVYRLFQPTAPLLAAQVGTLHPPVADELLRPVVNDAIGVDDGPLGGRLLPDVLSWLYRDGVTQVLPSPDQDLDGYRLRAELAVQLALRDPRLHRQERALAVLAALNEHWVEAALTPFFEGPLWTIRELLAVERRFPGTLDLDRFAPTVKSAEPGQPLETLCQLVLENRGRLSSLEPYGPGDLIRMRQLAQRDWWTTSRFRASLEQVLAGGIHGLRYPEVSFSVDAVESLLAAMVLAATVGEKFDDVKALALDAGLATGVTTPRVWRTVREATRINVALEDVVVAALLGEPRFPEPQVCHPVYQWAHGIQVQLDGAPGPILRRCVTDEIASGWLTYEQLVVAVHERLWELVRRLANPERAFRVVDKYAQSWLRPLFPSEGLLGRFRSPT